MTIKETGAGGFRPHDPQGDHQRQGDDMPVAESPQYKPLNPKSKRAAVLRCFLERGEAGLNCFEAVRLCHDFVLRTTVSECKRYHGIEFQKSFEQVPGYAGSTVDCVRYVLTPAGAAKVRELLSPTDPQEPQPQRERRLAMTQDRWSRALRAQQQALSDRAARKAA
jgi:hypothetical protein